MHIEICVVFQAKIVGQRSTAISDIIFGIWYYSYLISTQSTEPFWNNYIFGLAEPSIDSATLTVGID
jgi:hypothetical protein